MKKIKYPDHTNSTVSLANSVLKYFGVPVHYETLGLLDRKFAEPDGCMHEKGCYRPEAKATLRQLEKQVQELTEKLSDTLVIVTAF